MAAGLLQAEFLTYLETYTDSPASIGGLEVESRIHRPFLKRTMMSVKTDNEEDRELLAMEGTRMQNGLECKLMTSTSKVSSAADEMQSHGARLTDKSWQPGACCKAEVIPNDTNSGSTVQLCG